MNGPRYVLDSCVFIQSARMYYAFDVVPVFWDILIDLARDGKIGTIDRVKEELERGHDELAGWIQRKFVTWCASTRDDEAVVGKYAEVMSWLHVQGQYLAPAKHEFASGADGWLIAYGLVHGCTVVTHEVFSAEARRRVPIPNVCSAFGLEWTSLFEMLRRLAVRIERVSAVPRLGREEVV